MLIVDGYSLKTIVERSLLLSRIHQMCTYTLAGMCTMTVTASSEFTENNASLRRRAYQTPPAIANRLSGPSPFPHRSVLCRSECPEISAQSLVARRRSAARSAAGSGDPITTSKSSSLRHVPSCSRALATSTCAVRADGSAR